MLNEIGKNEPAPWMYIIWRECLGYRRMNQVQTVISTIAATVALAYLFPDRILSCNLEQQWQGFFQLKNAHAIRSI